MKKAFSLAMAVVMMLSVTLTGCQKEEAPAAPDQVAVALFDMMLKDDAAPAVELFGYASEAEAREDMGMGENLYDELAEEMVKQFEGEGATVSTEDVQNFIAAFRTMFSDVKLSAAVKESDEKAGTAVVTCTINTFDSDAMTNAMTQVMTDIMTDESLLTSDEDALYSAILNKMAEAISQLRPTEDTVDFDVDFVLKESTINGKERKVWLPEDETAFGEAISSNALGM